MSQPPSTSQAAQAPGTAVSAHLEADVSEQAEIVLSVATTHVPSAGRGESSVDSGESTRSDESGDEPARGGSGETLRKRPAGSGQGTRGMKRGGEGDHAGEETLTNPEDGGVLPAGSGAGARPMSRGGEGDHAGEETLTITCNGEAVPYEVVVTRHGTRLHVLPEVPPGRLVVDYRAHFTDMPVAADDDPAESALDHIVYVRPSRYCESDALGAVAGAEFPGLAGGELLAAVTSWVGQRLAYVSGSSRFTDGAVQTYIARRGVCRDFAHLVVALLRARGVPARLASVYAPGLSPMDFHAVAEAQLDGRWYVVDATGLAPRQSMLRIATGRDAADTAFMTTHTGRVRLTGLRVTATAQPTLPVDDPKTLVRLP